MRRLSHIAQSLLACAVALWLAAGAVLAQTTPDYEAWERTADRAQSAVDNARASDAAFEALRSELVDWRSTFTSAQDINRSRIATLNAQIDALGPRPSEGTEEPADIASRRAELEAQMAELRRPVLAAEEAAGQASGLISEIDRITRDRHKDALFERGPSPLNPTIWPDVPRDASRLALSLEREFQTSFKSPQQRAILSNNAPLVLGFTAVALLLLFRARAWLTRYSDRYLSEHRKSSAIWFTSFTFARALLPILGILALDEAIFATGMVGFLASSILERVPYWAMIYFGYRWIANVVFSADPQHRLMPCEDADAAEARYRMTIMAIAIVLVEIIFALGDRQFELGTTQVVLLFPVKVLMAWSLFRLGRILRRDLHEEGSSGGTTGVFFNSVTSVLGRALQIVAVVGPVLALAGYARAANATLFPSVGTIAILGLVMVLQNFLAHLYARVINGDENATDGLAPTLLGIALVLGSLPVLAMVWGVRHTDLADLWDKFNAGFRVGETTISPSQFLFAIIIFAVLYSVTRLVQGALRNSVLPKTKIDPGGQNAITAGLGYVGVFLAALIGITSAGIDLSAFAIFASALAVGIGFGMQTIVSNFVSGIILLVERPINEGDWIEVGGQMGYVRNISVRSTRIETFDRSEVIVPNTDLISGVVTNWTRGNTIGRVIVPVGVAYGTDTRRVETILREIAETHPMVLASPPPTVIFQGFGADSLDFEIRAILRDVNWVLSVKSDMNHEIARRFTEEGIEIPFAQRDIWLRNPETLRGEDT